MLPSNRPIVRDLIDENQGVSDEHSVFAFQAPPCEGHPLGHAGSDGHSGARVAVTVPMPSIINSASRTGSSDSRGNPFEVTRNGSIEFRENTLAVLRTVPFSTPGPGCALSARYPRESDPTLSYTTNNGVHDAMDAPQPFSTPGPFASPRPVSGHVSSSYAVAPHMVLDEAYPTIQKSSTIPILGFHTTKPDRVDTPLSPVQDGGGQFSALPNVIPGFASNNIGGLLFSAWPVPPSSHIHSLTKGFSSSPALATEPTFPEDRGVITPSPGLIWLSPVELTDVDENIAYDDVSMLNSDDLLSKKTPFCASSLFRFPISPEREGEAFPVLGRHMAPFDTCPRTPIALPQFMLQGPVPTNFDWVSPHAQSPASSESIDREDRFDVNASPPVVVREQDGIFAPTRDIFLSPLL